MSKKTKILYFNIDENNYIAENPDSCGLAVENKEMCVTSAEEDIPNAEENKSEGALDKQSDLSVEKGEEVAENNHTTEKTGKWKKIERFFDRNWLYFSSPLIIFSLFMAVLYAYNVYPFSHKSMSNYDLLAQICPFLEHFYDVIEGKSSLFYSSTVAGGADIFGTLAYCAISPFTFLFFLCGKGNVYYAVSFVLPIKLCCVALSAIYFIKKTFVNIPEHYTLIISILYAYCGYMFVANTYINWVDFLIYMPFVIMGFEKLVKQGKIKYFAISYALMIYTCFSIACFALLLVFLIFIAYVVIVAKNGERGKILTKMCISLVCAVALALPVMVPALLAYIKSGRNTGLFENMMNPLNFQHLNAKLSYIFSDTLMFTLTILYFIKSRFKRPIDRFLLVTGILIMMPVMIDEVCNLLNAGSYMSYALRFGFLNASYMLYVGCSLLNQIKEKKPRNEILNIISSVVFVAVAAVCVVFIINFNNSVINDKNRDFSSLFAHSLGGLDVIAPIAGVIAALIVIGALLYTFRITSIKVISFVLIPVCAVQVAFYNAHLVSGNLFDPVRYDQYNEIFDTVKENYEKDSGEYYRIKDYDDAITNAVFATHTDSYSVFSSVIDRTNFAAPLFFKYNGNGINVIKSEGGVFFGDALLGYKYYFLHNDQKRHKAEERSYNEVLRETQLSYFVACKNNLCFPNAYYVKSRDLVFDGNYYENMQKLYNFLGGEGELFYDTVFGPEGDVKIEAPNYSHPDSYMVKIYMVKEGQWFFNYNFPPEYDVYYSFSTLNEQNQKPLDGSEVMFGYHARSLGTYHYVFLKAYGENQLNEDVIKAYCGGRCLPLDKIEALKPLLESRRADYTREGGDKFDIHVTTDSDGCYLFMNNVAIDGFEITVNGKKREFIDNGLNFMLVELDEGENHVVIDYHSPYIKLIFVGILLGIAIIAALWYLTRKMPKTYGVVSKIINFAAVILAIGVFGFFIAYPTAVFLVKLFKLIFGTVFLTTTIIILITIIFIMSLVIVFNKRI